LVGTSYAAAVTSCGHISLALLAPAHHHIDLPVAAAVADQPLTPIENSGSGEVPSRHLGGIGLDLMLGGGSL
jgi:hypothetical protein